MSVKRVPVANLSGLIRESTALAAEYRRLLRKFPESGVVHRIMAKSWHPEVGRTDLPADLAKSVQWSSRLREYLRELHRYFVVLLERPDTFDTFPMIQWALTNGFTNWETINDETCLRCLEEHRQLLLIEEKKQSAPWHAEFRSLVREAISMAGHSHQGVVKDMEANGDKMDRKTLEDYLNGKRDNPRISSLYFMRNYVLRHRSSAKGQIDKLFSALPPNLTSA